MRSSQPPVLATWLLERFAVSPNSTAIAGDLTEEYRSGRSAAWFWRQALVAVLLGAWRDLLGHKLHTLRAVAVGYFVNWLFAVLWTRVWEKLDAVPLLRFHLHSTSWWPATLLLLLLIYVPTGWVIGRLHRGHRISMVLAYATLSGLQLLYAMQPELWMHVRDSVDQPRFRPYLALDVATVIVSTLGLLFGALMSAHKRPALGRASGPLW